MALSFIGHRATECVDGTAARTCSAGQRASCGVVFGSRLANSSPPIRPEEIIGAQAYIENNCLIKMVTPRGGRVDAHRLRARAPAKDPSSWLNRTRALAPLGLAQIALARIGPSAPIAIKDLAEFVKHFCSNPNTPAGKGFACGSGRAFLLPSSTHRVNFQQVRAFRFCFRHGLECYGQLLKTRCLYAAKGLQISFFPLAGKGPSRLSLGERGQRMGF